MDHRPFKFVNTVQLMEVFVLFADAINPIQSLHLGQY